VGSACFEVVGDNAARWSAQVTSAWTKWPPGSAGKSSIGIGRTIVVFFSVPISTRVCRKRS